MSTKRTAKQKSLQPLALLPEPRAGGKNLSQRRPQRVRQAARYGQIRIIFSDNRCSEDSTDHSHLRASVPTFGSMCAELVRNLYVSRISAKYVPKKGGLSPPEDRNFKAMQQIALMFSESSKIWSCRASCLKSPIRCRTTIKLL